MTRQIIIYLGSFYSYVYGKPLLDRVDPHARALGLLALNECSVHPCTPEAMNGEEQ